MLPDSTQYHKTIPKFKKNLQIGEHNCGFVGWPKQALSLYIISRFLLFASWHNGFWFLVVVRHSYGKSTSFRRSTDHSTNNIRVRVMVLNATFNTFSIISWRSVLLVEKLEYPMRTTDLPLVTYKLIT
jgi:hypothetical protein